MEGELTLMLGDIMINELKTQANASELQLCNEIKDIYRCLPSGF